LFSLHLRTEKEPAGYWVNLGKNLGNIKCDVWGATAPQPPQLRGGLEITYTKRNKPKTKHTPTKD